jgi:hypothetical protein
MVGFMRVLQVIRILKFKYMHLQLVQADQQVQLFHPQRGGMMLVIMARML